MTEYFVLPYFLIGVTAASGVGPIFLLILNSSSLFGFWKGFATALGASLADTFYFMLAMIGVLSMIQSYSRALIVIEGASSFLLTAFGIHLMLKKQNITKHLTIARQNFTLSVLKSFLLTSLNPFTFFFFIFINVNVVPTQISSFSNSMILLNGLMVGCGSLTVLTAVALMGSLVGSKIKRSWLEIFSRITGLIFCIIGLCLMVSFCLKIVKY